MQTASTASRPTWHAVAYWVTTALVGFAMLSGGAFHITQQPDAVKGIAALGFPAYFCIMLGTGKLLGGLTILLPRLPRLKEWAYAGISINLISAGAAHAFHGDSVADIATPLIVWGLAMVSWCFRPASRKL